MLELLHTRNVHILIEMSSSGRLQVWPRSDGIQTSSQSWRTHLSLSTGLADNLYYMFIIEKNHYKIYYKMHENPPSSASLCHYASMFSPGLTSAPAWQVTRSSPNTNIKGELRKKNNTINKIIKINPHPIYLSQFLLYWLLDNITPQSHNLYEKDPFTTLVLRDYHASTNLPACGPALRTSAPIVQLYELAR